MAQLVARSTVSRCVVCLSPRGLNIFGFPPVLRDWVIKGLGMYSRVCATGHIFFILRKTLCQGITQGQQRTCVMWFDGIIYNMVHLITTYNSIH